MGIFLEALKKVTINLNHRIWSPDEDLNLKSGFYEAGGRSLDLVIQKGVI
jgi:hypothetical protein